MENDYNTDRTPLVLMEYGRNVQKLVDFIKKIEDKEKRTQYALTLKNLMRQIAPSSVQTQETEQKLWDDMFIISGFDLEIDSPFPVPEEKMLTRKPEKLDYHNYKVKLRHYGRNMELLIDQALEIEDEDDLERAVIYIGKLMKTFQATWNKESADDAVILENIKFLSDGKLTIDLEKVKEGNLFEVLYKEKGGSRPKNHRRTGGGGGKKRRRY